MKPPAASFLHKGSGRITLTIFKPPEVPAGCWWRCWYHLHQYRSDEGCLTALLSPFTLQGTWIRHKCWMACWWADPGSPFTLPVREMGGSWHQSALKAGIWRSRSLSHFCGFTGDLDGWGVQSVQLWVVRRFTPWRKHLPFSVEIGMEKG